MHTHIYGANSKPGTAQTHAKGELNLPERSEPEFPMVLSPNLGCPGIVSLEDLANGDLITLVIAGDYGESAFPLKDAFDGALYIRRSFNEDGNTDPIPLVAVEDPEEIRDWNLLSDISSLEDTLYMINSELHYNVLGEGTRYLKLRVKLDLGTESPESLLRVNDKGATLPCVYDLVFLDEESGLERVNHHSIQFTGNKNGECRFIHLTDLHVAKRNDEILGESLKGECRGFRDFIESNYINFNDNFRKFIRNANDLADDGKLDFVVITGDLVDFSFHGWDDGPNTDENNWRTFIDICTGRSGEEGLKVALFTTTGNHDWRLRPYDPVTTGGFGISKELLKHYQYKAFDSSEYPDDKRAETARRIRDGIYDRMNMKAISGRLIESSSRHLTKWYLNLLALIGLIPSLGFFDITPGTGKATIYSTFRDLCKSIILDDKGFSQIHLPETEMLRLLAVALGALAGAAIVWGMIYFFKNWFIRKAVDFIVDNPLHAEARALHYYLRHVNPYLDYAVSYGGHSLIFMDTGSDVFNGQLLDNKTIGDIKKMSVEDNIIGMSPDSRAFDSAQLYYNWSQIVWLEKVLSSIKTYATDSSRVFVFLHAPPINPPGHVRWHDLWESGRLDAPGDWKISDYLVSRWPWLRRFWTRDKGRWPKWIPREEYNLTYGSINHYLSQFFWMCAGRKMCDGRDMGLAVVDLVFSGHAHRNLEFRLSIQKPNGSRDSGIRIYSDVYSGQASDGQWWKRSRPIIVQTAACGLKGDYDPAPPYYRKVELDNKGLITGFGVVCDKGKVVFKR